MADKAVVAAEQEIILRGLIAVWKRVSKTIAANLPEKLPPAVKAKGLKNLEALRLAVSTMGLVNALDDYDYVQDPLGGKLDYVTVPWYTTIIKKGDCDDSAWLCAEAHKEKAGGPFVGAIYDIVEMSGLQWKAGHLIYVAPYGTAYSNFKKVKTLLADEDDLRTLAKKYVNGWTHIVTLNDDFKVLRVLTR
jgi:hypothetical protein